MVALRLRIEQRHRLGWQELKLTWQGRDGLRSASAYPLVYPGVQDVIFVINDQPTNLRIEPMSLCRGLPILRSEWLIAP